jgi:hypothetical protein
MRKEEFRSSGVQEFRSSGVSCAAMVGLHGTRISHKQPGNLFQKFFYFPCLCIS